MLKIIFLSLTLAVATYAIRNTNVNLDKVSALLATVSAQK